MGYRDNDACLAKVDPDEPIFVLRAQDISAPEIVEYWLTLNVGTLAVEKRLETIDCVTAMRNWQIAHQDRVKRPD